LTTEAHAERSWRLQARPADFQFVLHHPDIAFALLDQPVQLSQISQGTYTGKFFGLRMEWQRLPMPGEELEGRGGSFIVKLSSRFLPIGMTWQMDVATQLDGHELMISAHLHSLSSWWMALWFNFTQSLWQDVIYALLHSLGQVAEKLSRDSLEESLRSLSTREQQESLRKHWEAYSIAPRSVTREPYRSAALLSVLGAGDQTWIRFQTDVPRPRRGQEALLVNPEARAQLIFAFERLAQAGSAFSTLRGANECRVLGRDLHERLIQLGRQLYALYIPKGTHGHLTSLLDAHPKGLLRIEVEGEASALPWELLHNGEDFLTLLLPVARIPVQVNKIQQSVGPVRRILLVIPESDLGEALAEIQAIYDVLANGLALHVEVLAGSAATKEGVVRALREGAFDALHYSGHSHHDPELADASHLVLSEGRKLRADELRRIAQESALRFIFLNSCASGSAAGYSQAGLAGLADAFVQSGVPCVIGMRWPISDRGARVLALTFYQALAEVGQPAEALRRARLAVGTAFDWEDPTWAAPLIYLP